MTSNYTNWITKRRIVCQIVISSCKGLIRYLPSWIRVSSAFTRIYDYITCVFVIYRDDLPGLNLGLCIFRRYTVFDVIIYSAIQLRKKLWAKEKNNQQPVTSNQQQATNNTRKVFIMGVEPEYLLDEITPDDFDALAIPGGFEEKDY